MAFASIATRPAAALTAARRHDSLTGREVAAQQTMILAQRYLARYGSCFDAYMALQRALMQRYLMRGGTKEVWCERFAPVYRKRYWPVFVKLDCPDSPVISPL